VRDDLVEHVAVGVLLVQVRRVHIARHHGEQLYVLAAQGTGERRGIADLDLIERAVLDEHPRLDQLHQPIIVSRLPVTFRFRRRAFSSASIARCVAGPGICSRRSGYLLAQ
jgi:hypothetical protein